MERNSFIYRLRRKCQVIAHQFFSDEIMSKLYFRIVLGKKLNLEDPQTFNEKIQWMKLYYYPNDLLAIIGADKYKVREYISQKGLADKLVPLYGVWSRADEINWESLPDKFVLKCNHGCAYNIVVDNKNKSDKSLIVKQLNKWLKEDFP